MISSALRNLPVFFRLIPSLKKRYFKLVHNNDFVVRSSLGARFILNPRNYVDREILFFGAYEKKQIEYISALSARLKPDCFLDVGANFGYYSVLFARRALAPQIIAFEADERNARHLKANLFLNRISDKVRLVEKAASASNRVLKFHQASESSTGQSRVSESEGNVEVEAVTLDSFLNIRNKTIIMKLDVEGHEAEVLQGMKETLGANRMILQIESFGDGKDRIQSLLEESGYRIIHSIDDDHFFTNTEI